LFVNIQRAIYSFGKESLFTMCGYGRSFYAGKILKK